MMFPEIEDLDCVVIDVDGVLTDGKQYVGPNGGKLFKAFCGRDIKAIRWLIAQGVRVVVMTADDWPGAARWAWKAGAEYCTVRDKAKAVSELDVDLEKCAMIGDDAWDLEAMKLVAYAFAPADYEPCLLYQLDNLNVIGIMGGQGVVAGFVQEILRGY